MALIFARENNNSLYERRVKTMEEIKWTKSYIESLNSRLEAVGMPKLIIHDGFVYKDELHKILGIGIKLEEES